MRLVGNALRDELADAWDRWGHRCAGLTAAQWRTTTRLESWDVQSLVAHVCPEVTTFDDLAEAREDGAPAVTDAAEMLRIFNRPDGVANTTADQIAERAVLEGSTLTPPAAAARFLEAATHLRRMPEMARAGETVIRYPIVGSTTLGVVAEVALMEATVHLLDLADAVGGVAPSPAALAATRDLLIAVPDPAAAVEALAGRTPARTAVPAIR
ncbi:maleylpyruvate isomerase N-terminal domain-containing protein [Mycolicibacterium sp. 050232]|uniref:maleylpyruvate isomerase N-terminal domain-containing protein n=1 Tax=Mycolicibacterium sp. 050232 TaxID=3113982 RepID=UPI002E28F235|nr:maleylpyruvate isomerase N-terminal domain-containing protein [Mycolicibacterium sp. 050232]MED5815344.1 maleylpyruvate isomerase N-terminal domain-containing protein [Mycolicibacterium sp. 050232]